MDVLESGGLPTEAMPRVDWGRAAEALEAIGVAVYVSDIDGRITYFNKAAVGLWGQRPALGESMFGHSWKLLWPDGSPLPVDESPMAIALQEGRAIRGGEATVERADGSQVPFLPFAMPVFDRTGAPTGAVNVLIDLSDRRQVDLAAHRLAAIVESSDDAIVAKDLNGVITDWNRGAEQIFGYTAEEAVGRPITIIIPSDRRLEEVEILTRIRNGERVEHFETIRRRKDGLEVPISLTVSPIRDHARRIIGASKIARDISERYKAQERQMLLLREMSHRVKNLFALSSAVVTLSARQARTPEELATAVRSRLGALARAHDLILAEVNPKLASTKTTLAALIGTIVAPYDATQIRVTLDGPDVPVSGHAVTGLALALHEFATNAAKYGALSHESGAIDVSWSVEDDELILVWAERGGPEVTGPSEVKGFGTFMADMTVSGQLAGAIARDWRAEGLVITVKIPVQRLSA
ncbi:PAS domain S-box protein [Inquilinus limosus]|uniref:PAS domain S-box protein n=1 Tax=Inquilinus limosus TaxID=171674 RepID=UPI003F13929C